MYFMLGNIAFEPVNLTDFSENHAADFAEHAVLKGKPRLQAMGEKLTELSFAIRLHHKIGGVESRYQALLAAKAKQEALALIWGAGKYKGNYVITDIYSATLFTDKLGNALAREMTINLREYVGDIDDNPLGAALNLGSNSLLGSILPDGAVKVLSDMKETVQKGAELFNQGRQIVNEVRNTIAIVRQLTDDPTAALAYLPDVLGNLDGALDKFGELTDMSELFGSICKVLPAVGEFSREMGGIYDNLMIIKDSLTFGNQSDGANWNDWFTPADNALSDINERIDNAATPVAAMTAWIVLREDEEVTNDTDRT
ncbi:MULTISPECIES: phage tail protein [Pasteurellaceae]|uniref:phage tail protein n=1 Tax=Pasteurellaceae TaxID=712 RepID=UPI00291E8E3F|nr:tail protein [uncultured phage]